MIPKIKRGLNNLRCFSGEKGLIIHTSSNIYSALFSTAPHRSDAGEWAINLFTVFAEMFEVFSMGWNAVHVGVVILNRSFSIMLSRTIRD